MAEPESDKGGSDGRNATGGDGAPGRLYWIQGRRGAHWHNLEHHEAVQTAIARLAVLLSDKTLDELRLIQAEVSAIDGRCEYLHICTLRDGQLLAPNSDAWATLGPHDSPDALATPDAAAALPQLLLWPDGGDGTSESDSEAQPSLPLGLGAAAALPAAPAPRLDAHGARARARDTIARRRPRDAGGRNHRRRRRPLSAGVLSAALAGAMATGLALAAVAPERAAGLYRAAAAYLETVLPRPSPAALIATGEVSALRERLADGIDPNALDANGVPLLLRAARAGNLPAVTLLIRAGADPTARAGRAATVLHQAAAEGHVLALGRMLDAGAPVDATALDDRCRTPLVAAAANGRYQAAEFLAARGARLTPQSGCSAGPIEAAAERPALRTRLQGLRARRGEGMRVADATPRPAARAPTSRETETPAENAGAAAASRTARVDETAPAAPRIDRTWAAADFLFSGADADADPTAPIARLKPEPPQQVADAGDAATRLGRAIEAGDIATVERLAADLSAERLNALRVAADDRYGRGRRPAVDHALLRGRRKIAAVLAEAGATPTPAVLHTVIANADRPDLAGAVDWLMAHGADPDARVRGMTALMRAAERGHAEAVDALLAAGGDPAATTDDSRTAADIARAAGRPEIEERLVLAARAARYRDLMLGTSWRDTRETLADRIRRCKNLGNEYTACTLEADLWPEDAETVVAQFDRRSGGRLVALQIDSAPFDDPRTARARFDAAVEAIEARLPDDHAGFTSRRAPEAGFFHALRPGVDAGAYFGYWPDKDRRRPVFVHLTLTGVDDSHGIYRIVIGNPFRAS